MVKLKDWDDFCLRSWGLASTDPSKTRWTIKLSTVKNLLAVKVTNNVKTYIYKLEDIGAEFNKVKQFSLSMTRYLTRHDDPKLKKQHRKRG